jgi:stage V sporulation protein B
LREKEIVLSDIKKQSFVKGAAILAVSAAIIKIMGAIYKIPLQHIIGDEGMGHFGVTYQIYSLLLTLSTAGLPIALSRMVSSANAMGRTAQVKRTFNVALMTFFILGIIGTLIMLLFPETLALAIEETEAESAPSIRVLAPAIIFVCLMSAYRGYTQGLSNMVPTSVSQIIETASKLVFGLPVAWWLVRQGEDMAIGSAGAIFGVTMGTFLGLIFIVLYTMKMNRRNTAPTAKLDVPDSRGSILKQLITICIPIVIGSCVLSIVAMIDTRMIYSRLQNAVGLSYDEANVLYGVYFNTQTLFNLPSAFIVPLTVSAIPAIAAFAANKRFKDAGDIMSASIKLTNLIAIPAAVGMSVLSYPIMNVLYKDSHPEGVAILAYLGIASYFVCLYMVSIGILQAYGHERKTLVTLIIGGLCKIAFNYFLIGNPDIGIRGAAISSIACYFIISILNIALIYRCVPQRPKLLKLFIKPLLASAIMGVCAYSMHGLLDKLLPNLGIDTAARLGMALAMGISILISIIVYLLLVIALRVITKEELELVPKGDKIAKALRIK